MPPRTRCSTTPTTSATSSACRRLLAQTPQGWRSEANLLVMRTRRDCLPETLFVGRTLDHVVRTADGLRLAERLCIFDNDLLPNSIVDPI